jgi:hypothetical protein
MLYFERNIATIPSNCGESLIKYAENAIIRYQYPYYIASYVSDGLDIPGDL